MWEKHPRVFLQLADETDPEFLGDGLLLDLAYEEEFSQIILPYNTKEYTIDQAKEILMKYASIYPEVVKHMKECKRWSTTIWNPQSLKFNLQISTKRRSLMKRTIRRLQLTINTKPI